MDQRAFYTGTLRVAGHYFWISDHESELYGEDILTRVPNFIPVWAEMWYGVLLTNGKIPDRETGEVHAIPAKGPWIAFVWCDRSVDSRPGSNSGFYVSGFDWVDRGDALKFAMQKWPDVVKRQRYPLVLVKEIKE